MDIHRRQKLIVLILYALMAFVFVGLPVAAFFFYQSNSYPHEALQMARFSYPESSASCSGSKTGLGGNTEKLKTAKGFNYSVKTPLNYQSTYPHPLLVVYAPSVSGGLMEEYVGLTNQATRAGFIIAYVDGQRLSLKSMAELGTVPMKIIEQWCIDEQRVFFTGHSDGGTLSSALAFLPDTPFHPAAIAPSAAGITGAELSEYPCPKPLSVMVMHNKGDTHFPGFGQQAAKWWAGCNQCDEMPVAMDITGACVKYRDCSDYVETLYCEGKAGSHLTWPRLNSVMIEFFQRSPPAVK